MYEKYLVVNEVMAFFTDSNNFKNAYNIPLKQIPEEFHLMVRTYNNDFFTYTLNDIISYIIQHNLTDETTLIMLNMVVRKSFDI